MDEQVQEWVNVVGTWNQGLIRVVKQIQDVLEQEDTSVDDLMDMHGRIKHMVEVWYGKENAVQLPK